MRRALIAPPVVVDPTVRRSRLIRGRLGQGLPEHLVESRPVHRPRIRHSSSKADNCATTYETSGHSVAIPSRMAARLGARLATTVLPDTPT